MKEAIREEFLKDWIHQASTEEIVEKLIQNDERAKVIDKAIEYIEKDLHISILPNNQIIHGNEVVKRINKILSILRGETNE